MKMSKSYTTKMATLILTLLIVSSSFLVLATPTVTNANVSATSIAQNVTAEYGDPLQYEWPQWYGSEYWDNFNSGPAPVAGDLLWKVRALGASSGRYYPSASNGKVFIYSGNRMIAFNGITGAIDWAYNYTLDGITTGLVPSGRGVSTGMPYKIDNDHMIAGRVCINPNTGAMYWYCTGIISRGVNVTFATSGGWGGGAGYSSTEKIFFNGGRAWDFSDLTHPPTILWDITNTLYGGESPDAYGRTANGTGVVLYKSGTIARGIVARTGKVLWSTLTSGGFSSYRGMYYNGLFYKGMIDDSFWAFDAGTGEVVWKKLEHVQYSNFATGSAAAYGMVYMIAGDGILYALNAKTGDTVWKYQAPGWSFYQGHPLVADGKVYATCPDSGVDPFTGRRADTQYICLDALTGKLIWKILGLGVSGGGGGTHLIAYGNLYCVSESGYLRCYGMANTDWPMFRHDPALSGTGKSGPSYLSLKWKFPTQGAIVSSPSIVADKVYIGSWDQNLYCLNALTGAEIWKFPTGTPIGWSPAVVNGKVYTGASDGNVYCIDAAAGTQIWKQPVGPFLPANLSEIQSSPIVANNKVYVGAVDSKLYCLDATTGTVLWSFETVPGEKRTGVTCVKSTAAVIGNDVWITGSPTGPGGPFPFGMFWTLANASLYRLDAATGNLELQILYPYGPSTAPTTGAIFSSPLVVGDRVFISDQNCYWYCFNTTSGAQIWRYRQTQTTQIMNTAAYFDGMVVFTDGFFVTCVYAVNGTGRGSNPYLWREFMKREVYNSPTIASYIDSRAPITASERRNFKIYSSNNDNFIHVLNGTNVVINGTRKISFFNVESFIISSTSLYKGMAYIGSRDFNVYCFEEANLADYKDLAGNFVQYNPAPPLALSIKLNVDKTQVNKTNSESVTASGTVFPSFTFPLKVTFVKPDGSRIDEDATFDIHAGTFTASYTPDIVGTWSVVAWVAGDSSKNIADSYSNSINLNVIQYTPPEQPPPKEPTTTTIPIEYILAAVAIVVIIVVIAVAYMMIRRRKK